ncbi:MAG: hypothetical protein ACRDMX_17680 [Solirubrobacteraceae bacterium]
MVKRASWLSITPEPERELPCAVATLASGRAAAPEAVAAETARVQRLVLRGSRRRWLSYLHEVVGLTERVPAGGEDLEAARARARAVISNHHNLLLALPGSGARITAEDRALLTARTRIEGAR